MAVTKTPRLNLAKQAQGDLPGGWRDPLDTGFDDADARLFRTGAATDPNVAEILDYVGQNYLSTTSGLWHTGTALGTPDPEVDPGTWILAANDRVINKNASPLINTIGVTSGIKSAKPVSPVAGDLFVASDAQTMEFYDGTQWVLLAGDLHRGVQGMEISNAAVDTDHDIQVLAGSCITDDPLSPARSPGTFVKRIDGTWAIGTGNQGLFPSLSLLADTWYHFFAIVRDSDLLVDFGFDDNILATNIPGGYTNFRRIWSIKTDSSFNIIPFLSEGDECWWDSPILDIDLATPGTAEVSSTVNAPLGIRSRVFYNGDTDGANHIAYVHSPLVADLVPSESVAPLATLGRESGAHGTLSCFTNTASQIAHRSSVDDAIQISILGYVDRRGQDDS